MRRRIIESLRSAKSAEATEQASRDGEAGFVLCSECAELDEELLLAKTSLIWGNCADRLMTDQDFVR